jgi:CspA family cold shock protein
MKGTVKKVVTEKGFGFIEGPGPDVFFHVSAVENADFEEIAKGDAVEFESEQTEKGHRATSVRLIRE